MTDVFISYSRKDVGAVRELVRCIEGEGWTTFWDRDIPAGRNFQSVLQKELEQARCVVVVWSNNSASSTWVWAEAQAALDRDILVPVQIEACALPVPFNSIQGIKLEDWPLENRELEISQLISSIRRQLQPNAPKPSSNVVRNDPTLSTRVAERVVTQLGTRNNVRIEKALSLEQMVNRLLLGYFQGTMDVPRLLQSFVDGLLAELDSVGVWLLEGNSIRLTGLGSSKDTELLSGLAEQPRDQGPQRVGDYWIMKIGAPANDDIALVLVNKVRLDTANVTRLEDLSVILNRAE